MRRDSVVATLVCAAAVTASFSAQQQAPSGKVDFARDVQPILNAQCVGCHGPAQQMNGLRLDRRRDAFRGGTLPVISPGHGDTSRLILRLTGPTAGTPMPPTGPLAAEQIAVIKTWIDQGAEWPDEVSGDAPPLPIDPHATALIDALRRGNRREFTHALNAHPGAAKARGPAGVTPLMAATLHGEASDMTLLLEAGADPNLRNDANASALMWAVPDVAKMQLLLAHGADVNAKSDAGRTPLLIAAGRHGAGAAVKLLLEKGAKVGVRAPSLFGDTSPLVEAAKTGDEAVFQLLLDAGADPKTAGPFALAFAERSGCTTCAAVLLQSAPLPVVGVAALLLGPPLGDARLMTAMIDRGADPNGKDPAGRTALHLAASSGALPVDTIKALIDRGADVNAQMPTGERPLTLAKRHGATPVVDLLVKAGAKDERPAPSVATPSPAASPRAAIARALPLLQKSDVTFMQKAGCVSCHNNTQTAMTIAAARTRGLRVDEAVAGAQRAAIGSYVDSWRDRMLQGIGIPGNSDTISYILLGLAAEGHPADAGTDAAARFILGEQRPDGSWKLLAHRPPIESSDIEVTAASMRSLQLYAPAAARGEYAAAVQRAAAWLAAAPTDSTEARAFQLLGLAWAKAGADAIGKAARGLRATQRPDGGWAQIATMASDAYATGQALVALRESGAGGASDAAFRRGVQFLLGSQLADGSWLVRTRAVALQPYFESGFPHGRDQWISASATNWAVMALVHAVTEERSTASRGRR